MNLLFLDSEMRSKAMLIVQAPVQNIEVLFGRCFFKIFLLNVLWHILLFFSSLDPSMKMCKCLGYLSLTFSNSSWKITGGVLFLWNLLSVKFMFGVLMIQGGISGMIVLCISVKSMSTSPMFVSVQRPKGFMAFSFFWNSSLYFE